MTAILTERDKSDFVRREREDMIGGLCECEEDIKPSPQRRWLMMIDRRAREARKL